MKLVLIVVFLLVETILGSFWNEIPTRCIYNRERLLLCLNTTFIQAIPLFNDLTYTLKDHQVDIRYSDLNLTLNELFQHTASNIGNLTLIDNRVSPVSINGSKPLYFRSLQSLTSHSSEWFQLNASFYPQLISLDLSYNHLTVGQPLIFHEEYFPQLRSLNLSHNDLQSIDHLTGTVLDRIESLILSFNPLASIENKLDRFSALRFLDLSSTSIKHMQFLPHVETLHCRQCLSIPVQDYEPVFLNCTSSHHYFRLDFSQTKISSVTFFAPSMKCIKELVLNDQPLLDSITRHDLLLSTNLQSIEIRNSSTLDYIYLNVYDRLKSIDFSDNVNLNQLILYLMSNYTYLQRLTVSHAALSDFSIDFLQTAQTFLHIDTIDLSHNRLETLDFLRHLIFSTLDVSFNRLKIVDLHRIQFPRGIYDLSLMNLMNLSSNGMESIRINWTDESPHAIDLSANDLQSMELHGQTTYSLRLSQNANLSLQPAVFNADLPALQYLDLTAIRLVSLESLIYLHNLSNIHTLILDHNQLDHKDRTLNWHLFFPWHQYLTHLSLQNISLEKIDAGAYLIDYYHLLTIDFHGNRHLRCDCSLQPFINWLRIPPPPLSDFYEPLQKLLGIDCPMPLFDLRCDDGKSRSTLKITLLIVFLLLGVLFTASVIIGLICKYSRKHTCESYSRIWSDTDLIALKERHTSERTDAE